MANPKIIIDLNDSTFAHGFSEENQINAALLGRAVDNIKDQIDQIGQNDNRKDNSEDKICLNHFYRTIGIFGDRGSGKTSFLISLLEICQSKYSKDLAILPMIDPTLVEHKKPMVLCVIAMINHRVESYFQGKGCSDFNNTYEERRVWNKIMRDVATGLFAIDEVGKDYDDSLWRDEEYVMHTGLDIINKTNRFEENLRKMIREALSILGKKAFIISFDDIDVDVEQGWKVLETLRRYFSDEHIISIVTGNIKLYGMLVRNELCKNLVIPDVQAKSNMANELESQYMLKLLNPANRFNLRSLYNLVHYEGYSVIIKETEQKSSDIKLEYRNILKDLSIIDSRSQDIFIEFLLSMSIRSQIHFLKDALAKEHNELPLNVFASRFYAAGIDVEAIKHNEQLTNIVVLDYLRSTGNLPDSYLLLPTLQDKDVNSCFTAFTFLICEHLKTNPFVNFDYMLRIGYIRNLALPFGNAQMISDLCKYAGWNQRMSTKNNIGLTMAYMEGIVPGNQKEHIALFGMAEKAKKANDTVGNGLDIVLKNTDNALAKLLAMFPYVRILYNKKNTSNGYYSIFTLLAAINEIVQCNEEDSMISRINDLKLFRSYQMPQDENSIGSESDIQEGFDLETDNTAIKELASKMNSWKDAYKNPDTVIPPYVLGRIITRLYSSVVHVERSTVGKTMSIMVAAFFNSCLIEESKIKHKSRDHIKINNNNPRKTTDIFVENLGKSEIVSGLGFTKWIMACPMLNCFLGNRVYEKVQSYLDESLKADKGESIVYDILNRIDCKITTSENNEKPSFSGKANKVKTTIETFNSHGISNRDIIERIINERNIDEAIKYVNQLNIFSPARKGSMKAFRQNAIVYLNEHD